LNINQSVNIDNTAIKTTAIIRLELDLLLPAAAEFTFKPTG